jgi:phosphoribosylanthranilate isomerase
VTLIKICGITRPDDAAAAVALGADALGFILWKQSPRHIDLASAAMIIKTLPAGVATVAVLVSPSEGDLIDAQLAGFQIAQVHNDLPSVNGATIEVMRAVHLAAQGHGVEPDVPVDQTILLDAHNPVKHGGTGQTVDWTRARAVAAHRRIFLAGGLTAENVGEAIRTVQPYAVDVASGVEASPGIKDFARLSAFIQAVKETQ